VVPPLGVAEGMSFHLEGVAVRLVELGLEPEGEEAVFPPPLPRGGSGRAGRARFGARGGRGFVSPMVVRGAILGFTAYGPNVPIGVNGISDYCKFSDMLVLGSKPCDLAGGSEVGADQHAGPGSSSIGQPPSKARPGSFGLIASSNLNVDISARPKSSSYAGIRFHLLGLPWMLL
jgi:hypothetical protein